ncbi:hypothetical protein DmAi_25770 [Acetobacter persici]|uniref:Uncharacterized protein n=2 Tax=Acetobacter persici TaxID=1076596 RepID=A0A6V8IA76_9PROT|nr:hypothetical protein DmAi_25770 [Acetobacter persici]
MTFPPHAFCSARAHKSHPAPSIWSFHAARVFALFTVSLLLPGCTDDHGRGDMHAAVSECFSKYPFAKGTASQRFTCIYQAHTQYGSAALGAQSRLLLQIDLASLTVGQDVDSGVLTQEEGRTALRWVTEKAFSLASRNSQLTGAPQTSDGAH